MADSTVGVALDEVGTARLAIGVEIIRGRSGGIAALLVGGRRNLAVVKGAGRKILPVPPGTPYNRKVSSPSDKQGGASSRPTTDYFHTDGKSCRPHLIKGNTTGVACLDCDAIAIYDLSGKDVEEFFYCEHCFLVQRVDVVRAGVTVCQP